MGRLRRDFRCLNGRGFFYYYDEESHRQNGVIAFRRSVRIRVALRTPSLLLPRIACLHTGIAGARIRCNIIIC